MEKPLLVAVPRMESGIKILAESHLYELIINHDVLMLPLPNGLCSELVTAYLSGKSYDESMVSGYLNEPLEKLWRPLMKSLAVFIKNRYCLEKKIYCYLKDDYVKRLEENTVKLGFLLFKANVFGKKNLDEWIYLFKDKNNEDILNDEAINVIKEAGKTVIILDSYRVLLDAQHKFPGTRVLAITDFYPVPTEAFDILVNVTKAPIKVLDEAVDWIIRYLNELKLSSSLDELYHKFLFNHEYIDFLYRNKLYVIKSSDFPHLNKAMFFKAAGKPDKETDPYF